MTEDVTSLQIRIAYDSVKQAENSLRKFDGTATKTGKTVEGLGTRATASLKSLYAFAAGATAVTASVALMRQIVRTTAEFQKLNAQLVTATGTSERAAQAFEALKEFAATTPFDLAQTTNAFVKLVNLGLTPSERALRSYGDTASSMGKSLMDMIEAVADASTGEFERLKEFGIKASKDGDQITFRFRGVATTVKNTAKDIEGYLIDLGEKSFGGAMLRQMDTLNGKFSNLADSWDQLLNEIGSRGLGDAVAGGVDYATEKLQTFIDLLRSGEAQATIDLYGNQWGQLFRYIVSEAEKSGEVFAWVFDQIAGMMLEHETRVEDDLQKPWRDFGEFIQKLPNIFELAFKTIGATIDNLGAKAENLWSKLENNSATAWIENMGATVTWGFSGPDGLYKPPVLPKEAIPAPGTPGAGAFESRAGFEPDGMVLPSRQIVERQQQELSQANEALDFANERLYQQIDGALDDFATRDAAISAERDRISNLRDNYNANKPSGGGDRLEQFRVGGDGESTSAGKEKKAKLSAEQREFARLQASLGNQERLISESYARRFAIIENNTREGSAYQAELEISLTEKFQEEQQQRIDALKREPETMFEAFAEQERLIEESYNRRKEIILAATELTEAEKLKLLTEAEAQYTAQMRKHEVERNKMTLGLASDFFGNLSQIAGAFGKRGSKIAKAAAIAQTTIKTYEGATSAYASLAGIPYIGPVLGAAAAGAAVAAGFANIQRIRSTDDSGGYAGSYATGGIVGGTSYSGDRLTANVNSGEMILNASQQRKLFDVANGGTTGGKLTVNVHNHAGAQIETTERETADGKIVEIVVRKAEAKIAQGIREGSGPVSSAMEKAFNLRRGA